MSGTNQEPLIPTETLIGYIRRIFRPQLRPWALFRHGTVIGPLAPAEDYVAEAQAVMRRYGAVRPGSPVGDFKMYWSTEDPPLWPGWIVLSRDNQIVTYVGYEEMPRGSRNVDVGLFARSKRHLDTVHKEVVHIEAE